MNLVTAQIGEHLLELTRDELAQAELIQHTRSIRGSEAAALAWLKWAEGVLHAPARERRMAVGVALGLTSPRMTELERQAELTRRAKLYACPMHVFDMRGVEVEADKLPPRLTCVMCLEWLPTMEAASYARGFAAAGGDPDTVIEGFGR